MRNDRKYLDCLKQFVGRNTVLKTASEDLEVKAYIVLENIHKSS